MKLTLKTKVFASVCLLLMFTSAAYGLFGFCDIICLMQKYGISRVDRQFEYNEIASDYAFLNTIYPQRLFAGGSDLTDILQIRTLIDPIGDKKAEEDNLFSNTTNIADIYRQANNSIQRTQLILKHIAEVKVQMLKQIGELAADVEREAEKQRKALSAIQQDIERYQKSIDNLYASGISAEEYMKVVADNLTHIIESAAKRNELYVYIMSLLEKRARLTHLMGVMTAEKYQNNIFRHLADRTYRFSNVQLGPQLE